jgi:hypothetical protein
MHCIIQKINDLRLEWRINRLARSGTRAYRRGDHASAQSIFLQMATAVAKRSTQQIARMEKSQGVIRG